jgi:asparagine synthase (glutamine-hydrolysing)
MCGIAGFNWQDKDSIEKLTHLLDHRGPDRQDIYVDEHVSLGHARLSIIDLSERGNQPMEDKSGNYSIVFNGEIFNFQQIKKELKGRGYNFYSRTDTEVLLYGYIEHGREILEKIDGQFSFCIYNKKDQKLFLARDRMGINPLYYFYDGKRFIFGSELKVILESGIPKEIDRFALNYYFLYGYTSRDQSIIKNVKKLEPAHFVTFDLATRELSGPEKYWKIELTKKIRDEEQAKARILEELERGVRERMVADVPVGAFLSGGVDSSAVVAIMSKYTDNLNTFSIKFDHQDFDESHYARIVSEEFNTRHHVIQFSASDVRKLMFDLPYHYDEPFADPSMIPTYLVSKVASQHVTVSLSGDGGDELFGGYTSYQHYKLLNIQKYYPKCFNSIALKLIDAFNIQNGKLKKFFEIGKLDRKKKFAKLLSYLYKEEFQKITGDDPEKYYDKYAESFRRDHYLHEVINIDLHNYLSEDILTKVDRASMAHGLESRPPILDSNLVDIALSIHPKLKIKGKEGKYIFKKALEDILPHKIIYRSKQGFGVPLRYYLTNELKDLVYDYVINYKEHDFVGEEMKREIKDIIDQEKWDKDYSRIIWIILMFNLWYEKWMKK